MSKIVLYLKNLDWVLFFTVLLLLSFGLVEIYSVALGQDSFNLVSFKKQILFIGIGLSLFFFFVFFDYFNLRSFSTYIYIFGILLLLAVLFFGVEVRGTRGWFSVGPFNIQPVEFIKIVLIIFLAKYFSSTSIKLNPLKHLFISGLGTFVLAALVLSQPDFGSSLLLFALWGALVVVAGFKKRYFLIIIGIVFFVFISGWFVFFEDYQKKRISTFLNPSFDPLNQGYNVTQAIIAVGSGGLIGRGIGFGSQSQLKFLPEAQNDFIFAVISEELGFLGVSLVLVLFLVFFFRSIYILRKINNDFGIFIVLGIVVLIFIEMFINIGMNIGILPVVGISLPFISYGGSAIISSLVMAGIMQNIIIKSKINT
ncbi:rod shape-determining protein RodA [Candidatus Parcubacteria bacterium]|mgnify:CR=1 FL=1|nr:MAG: rod shape-determining protein RodA [Candidatus Parcubacteria bacterium]